MTRSRNTNVRGQSFSVLEVQAVWNKAGVLPGNNSAIWRVDACGAAINRYQYGKLNQYGWEIDHINPVSNGGSDQMFNLQPLQWENNRSKSDLLTPRYCVVAA